MSRRHLEMKPSALGVPGLTFLLPDHLRGPGCPGTSWLVVQRSLFSGRQPVCLQYLKANYPVSSLTFVLFCCVFWIFSGGGPATREKEQESSFYGFRHGGPRPKPFRAEGSPLRDLSPMASGHPEWEWGLWGLTSCLCVLRHLRG